MLETIITSSVLIAILILLRYFFKGKINLRLQYALWLLVAVRLLIPFSVFNSPFSVLNIAPISSQTERIESPAVLTLPESASLTDGNMNEGITGTANDSVPPRYFVQNDSTSANIISHQKASLKDILHNVWLIGAIAVGLWFILQNIWFYTRLRKTRETAEIPNSRLPVYLSRYVKSPCLFGFRPAIYIHPDSLTDDEVLKYILAHEETHYRHGDHLWSYLRCVCLALHWFNPLIWWAAVLSRRDCEIACDEGTLKRIGDEHRKAYGNTLINMIEHRAKPSDLLCSATTMTSGKSGIKERITMIAKKPKMLLPTLLVMILILAAAVGCTFTGANGNSAKDVALYERAGMTIAIPNEYEDQLLIDPVEYNDETTLIRVYQKSTYEKYEGMGFLFSIVRYTEAQHEQFLSSDGSGQIFFAKDETSYYGFFFATDVQAPDDYEAFSKLFSAVGDYVKSDMITRNGLTPYSDDEFFNRNYTYDSGHIFLSYYPYYAYNGSKEEVWTLILSQPVKQGDTGIWCVERWKDQNGNIYTYFPDENGTPSTKYYAERQAECDSGSDMSWLDPKQVALAFVKRVFDHAPATLDSLLISDNPASPADLFAASTGNIRDYMPDLLAGNDVSGYDLLPCLESFTHSTWLELDEAYGRDWWNPLWVALRDAAISDRPADSDDQSLRDYYIGKAYLVSDGAYAEGLADIVLLQWDNNSVLYSACLNGRFSAEEATSLRRSLTYSISYDESTFGLFIPGSERSIYLNAYPVDFPFGCDLTEKSRETHRAESFGQVTVVKSDGLQVTYLNPAEGVYTVITLRADKEYYTAAGVTIGDNEEFLLAHWPDKLKKLDGISYDDEAWFGSGYDHAYAYTPQESTISVVYLIKDGMVSGIEIINGLDGAMY
ncbi:Regulatory protein BlaR1 [Pelotomaculum schinkii]|uniref:Regulatory protein BlaR1 n=1 Tax=Pelotomaculum schinkii TaxID=78350 RepID=A0A4Y7RHW3_9FIRM|nr:MULTISPECIES: M56 family metallopeptidase [Pelotomaculum]TEB08598.1 Regulatory protein BlaR1 [Pelotomaculum schinkii]TEB16795.1 Regulatory protein BlaR1 [Pelotomaculum sp. FP]